MGTILETVVKNLKVIKGSKNDNQTYTQDMPTQLPSGQNMIEVARNEGISNSTIRKLEHQGMAIQNNKKDNNILKKAGKVYLGTMDKVAGITVPGYNKIKTKSKIKYHMKLKETQKLFQLVCKDYIENQNPGMTQESFRNKMEALRETKLENIDNVPDLLMKQAMMGLEKSYDEGRIGATHIIENFKNDVYTPEERLKKSISSFEKEYFEKKSV